MEPSSIKDYLQENPFEGAICSAESSGRRADGTTSQKGGTHSFSFVWRIESAFDVVRSSKLSVVSPVWSVQSPLKSDWGIMFHYCVLEEHIGIRLMCWQLDIEFIKGFADVALSLWKVEHQDSSPKQSKLFTEINRGKVNDIAVFTFQVESIFDAFSSKDDLIVQFDLTIRSSGVEKERMAYAALSAEFEQLLETRKMFDFEVRAGTNRIFPVHKIVLWTRASELAEHFGISPEQPSSPASFDVTDMEVDVLETLIYFLYSGKVSTKDRRVLAELQKVGQKFHIRDLDPSVCKCVARTSIPVERVGFEWFIRNVRSPSVAAEFKYCAPGSRHTFFFNFRARAGRVVLSLRKKSNVKCFWPVVGYIHITAKAKNESSVIVAENYRVEISEKKRSLYLKPKFIGLFQNDDIHNFLLDGLLALEVSMIIDDRTEVSVIERKEVTSELTPTNCENLEGLHNDWCALPMKRRAFSDVVLRVRQRIIPAHKAILCARSPVFERMFEHAMREQSTGIVDILDINSNTLNLFLNYLYSANFTELSCHQVLALYACADKYGRLDLQRLCSKSLYASLYRMRLKERNKISLELFLLADAHGDEALKTWVRDFICKFSESILRTKEWKYLERKRKDLASEISFNPKRQRRFSKLKTYNLPLSFVRK